MSNHQGLNDLVSKLTEHVTADAYFGRTKSSVNENTTPSDNIRHWTDLTDTQIMNMSESQRVQTAKDVREFLDGRRMEARNRDPLEALLIKIEYERLVSRIEKASTIDDFESLYRRFYGFTNTALLGSYKNAGGYKSKYESLIAEHREKQGLCRKCGNKMVGIFKKKCKNSPCFVFTLQGSYYTLRDIIQYGI